MSTFSGLHIGLSSLYAQRRGLETTGHNVSNANTEGYSRQRVRMQGEGGPITPALFSRYDGAGNGVSVVDTQRLRDAFLESRAAYERGTDGRLRAEQVALSRVEGIFGEPSDEAVQAQLADFWSSWDDVANAPTDLAARSQLLQRAMTLATGLNGASDRIEVQWTSAREQLVATVGEVNATADAVAEYNRAIAGALRAGHNPNDLADKRDLLVQKLATMAGVRTQTGPEGTVDLYLGDTALVSGGTAAHLVVQGHESLSEPADDMDVHVAWETSPSSAAPVSGTAGGLVAELTTILPTYRDELHSVTAALGERVNDLHRAGTDQDGAAGGDFFAVDSTNGRLSVAVERPAAVAASKGSGVDRGGANAADIAELAAAPDGPDQLYRKLIVRLGVDAQAANRRVDIQANILGQVDAARESEAGVNIDEEMTNMLAYQHAYEGAARFVSAVDEMLETLINRTGRVGL